MFGDRKHRHFTVILFSLGLVVLSGLLIAAPAQAEENLADFGDLPGPVAPSYSNTLLADDGARHYFVTDDVILGARRDADNNGIEDLAAAGDDYTGEGDDEDGVAVAGTWLAGPEGGEVWITASGPGCLTAWLDHAPADFDFDDAGEKIFDNRLVAEGTHRYSFPLMVTPGVGVNLYARFRLVPAVDGSCDEAQIVDLTGPVQGGEVEDYLWNRTPTAITLQATDAVNVASLPLWLALTAIGLMLASAAALRRQPVRVREEWHRH